MKIEFKTPCLIDGVKYEKGTHEVPESLATHWYVIAMSKDKNAIILEPPKAVEPEKKQVKETKKLKEQVQPGV